ncbi:MAG: DUF1292 domain-containing protein [Bacilli bacterium]|nr:DUF1292 domain-containing protein [Bacilli bacterium]
MENNSLENKNTFTVINDEGREILCNVLFTFDSDETKKSYIVYTDNTKDNEGNIKVYASIYDPKSMDNMELLPIETEKEWKVIETILESIQEEIRNQTSGNN